MGNKYLDTKVTIWKRINIPDCYSLEEIKKMQKENTLYDILEEEHNDYEDFIFETEEIMSLSENDNQSTMELFEFQTEKGLTQPILIWDNTQDGSIRNA
jgi:hypothetical protein